MSPLFLDLPPEWQHLDWLTWWRAITQYLLRPGRALMDGLAATLAKLELLRSPSAPLGSGGAERLHQASVAERARAASDAVGFARRFEAGVASWTAGVKRPLIGVHVRLGDGCWDSKRGGCKYVRSFETILTRLRQAGVTSGTIFLATDNSTIAAQAVSRRVEGFEVLALGEDRRRVEKSHASATAVRDNPPIKLSHPAPKVCSSLVLLPSPSFTSLYVLAGPPPPQISPKFGSAPQLGSRVGAGRERDEMLHLQLLDLALLSQADIIAGVFGSTFVKTALQLGRARTYASLDTFPWCPLLRCYWGWRDMPNCELCYNSGGGGEACNNGGYHTAGGLRHAVGDMRPARSAFRRFIQTVDRDFKCRPFAEHPLVLSEYDRPVVGAHYAPTFPRRRRRRYALPRPARHRRQPRACVASAASPASTTPCTPRRSPPTAMDTASCRPPRCGACGCGLEERAAVGRGGYARGVRACVRGQAVPLSHMASQHVHLRRRPRDPSRRASRRLVLAPHRLVACDHFDTTTGGVGEGHTRRGARIPPEQHAGAAGGRHGPASALEALLHTRRPFTPDGAHGRADVVQRAHRNGCSRRLRDLRCARRGRALREAARELPGRLAHDVGAQAEAAAAARPPVGTEALWLTRASSEPVKSEEGVSLLATSLLRDLIRAPPRPDRVVTYILLEVCGMCLDMYAVPGKLFTTETWSTVAESKKDFRLPAPFVRAQGERRGRKAMS